MKFSGREVKDIKDRTAFVLVSLSCVPFSPSSKSIRADLVLISHYSELCFHCYISSSESFLFCFPLPLLKMPVITLTLPDNPGLFPYFKVQLICNLNSICNLNFPLNMMYS